ncbi:MAG: hypothetical protein IJV01_04950 [Bacteroidales bacterium]|nr:hypothetical protein [Bacteroidales bacterium]
MRVTSAILFLALALSCVKPARANAVSEPEEIVFEASSCTADGRTLPYRYAYINSREGEAPIVVLVLHGGPLKGGDNEMQLEEVATQKISKYLVDKGINAILLAPHCPRLNSFGRQMNWVQLTGVLRQLISRYKTEERMKAYIFGASIGGVGTWTMLSEYPGLFAAAMPCAADPAGCDASAVAKTKVYTVMGTEDTWAPLERVNLQSFLDSVSASGGTYRFDIGEGWDHETTCRNSFSEDRLDWVFGW